MRSTAADRSVTFVWRRLHAGRLIAQVDRRQGMGSWHASAYPAHEGETERVLHSFSALIEAQRAADDLVRDHWAHTCETGVCGRWLRWPEE